jgi:alpha-beta hydrolase superfamily lysophospholipase
LNSHNKYGDFNCYNDQVAQALQLIQQQTKDSGAEGEGSSTPYYKTLLGYAHSTGGPVLLNYLMEHGDAAFDGFIFNSPFLDWVSVLCTYYSRHDLRLPTMRTTLYF